VTPATPREELKDTVREALGKAWRTAVAYTAGDLAARVAPLGYPEMDAETEKLLAAASAYAASGVTAALDAAGHRAEAARAELAALEGRISQVIAGAVQAEQARAAAADGKIAEVRGSLKEFLDCYGDSDLLLFKVGRDLANSILKILDRTGEDQGDGS
jgi:hypothetical protein